MQCAMIGLGRMGGNMARRLIRAGHDIIVYSATAQRREVFARETGACAASSLDELISRLKLPRVLWLMIPAGEVDALINTLAPKLDGGDIIIDGGNSYYCDDLRRAKELASRGVRYVDCGTSGGVWGLERGYCLMIGGEAAVVKYLDPLFASLAPGRGDIQRTAGREKSSSTAEQGYLHCGPHGAGHFVKMVHNGIEYGIMAAYAEGFNILRHANLGVRPQQSDTETTPLAPAEPYPFDFNLAEIAELWRRGSVISSWLLDLTATALCRDPELDSFTGNVADSGEGRWTVKAAVDEGVPAPVITAALYARFVSRGKAEFADKLLSAMRYEFGGHVEKAAKE